MSEPLSNFAHAATVTGNLRTQMRCLTCGTGLCRRPRHRDRLGDHKPSSEQRKPQRPDTASVWMGAHTTATSHGRHNLLTVSGDVSPTLTGVPGPGICRTLTFFILRLSDRSTDVEPRGLFLVLIFLSAFACEFVKTFAVMTTSSSGASSFSGPLARHSDSG